MKLDCFFLARARRLSSRIAVLIVFGCSFSAKIFAQQANACLPIDEEVRGRVIHSVARLFHTEPIVPVIDEERFVTGTCYWQVSVSAPSSDKHWVLYLSPDRRFLTGSLLDISVDPMVADEQTAHRLKSDEVIDRPPIRGSSKATVDIVVFADFQCPYCAVFAEMVERYRKANADRVRIAYRHLPTPVHDWAATAARASVCISQQSGAGFWKFHDFIFLKQKDITLANFATIVAEFLATSQDLSKNQFTSCLNSGLPQERLDQDLAEARSLNIDVTPTIFINGRKYTSFRDDAALAFAINLATPTGASKNASTAAPKN